MDPDFTAFLSRIEDDLADGAINLPQAAHAIGERACASVPVSQASLWVLRGEGRSRFMLRVGGFDAVAGLPLTERAALADAEFASYFDALTRRSIYVCADALTDGPLSAMRETYLRPQGVGALVDAAVGVNGSAWGVLCCEHRGSTRQWSASEIRGVKQMADAIALKRARQAARQLGAPTLMGTFVDFVAAQREFPRSTPPLSAR
jgi:GAF domain-containing protein